MSRRVFKNVVWLAPELWDVPQGQYRDVPEGEDPLSCPLLQWVDDAPGDPEDPAGHWVEFTGKPADYTSHKETVNADA